MKTKKLLPPAHFLASLTLQVCFHYIFPIVKFIPFPYNYIGVLFIAIGGWFSIWPDMLFKKYKTPVRPDKKPVKLIEEGPFKFSRNPMYLGMSIILIGIAIFLGSISPFVIVAIFVVCMDRDFIRLEEKLLEEAFGNSFLGYKKRVRRWL